MFHKYFPLLCDLSSLIHYRKESGFLCQPFLNRRKSVICKCIRSRNSPVVVVVAAAQAFNPSTRGGRSRWISVSSRSPGLQSWFHDSKDCNIEKYCLQNKIQEYVDTEVQVTLKLKGSLGERAAVIYACWPGCESQRSCLHLT